jgi:hypothetical protein
MSVDSCRAPTDWSFRRWLRESRSYTRPMAWWRFYPMAVRKWFWFDRQQRRDNAAMQAR